MIDADVVKFAHFGGFEADEKDPNPMHKKSRNEIMKEIIQKSKMHKVRYLSISSYSFELILA